jgi:hypothetical protein
MYSEINPPPQRPSMSKTNYHHSYYYSARKIALIDARAVRSDVINITPRTRTRCDRTDSNNQCSSSILQCDI